MVFALSLALKHGRSLFSYTDDSKAVRTPNQENHSMLTHYIQAAMHKATYEFLEDSEAAFYGEIPDCPGVWSTGKTLEECRELLQEVLEGWLLLGFQLHHHTPVIDGIDLNPQPQLEVA
jgi:predicted RNase H-like HicB family nuclease